MPELTFTLQEGASLLRALHSHDPALHARVAAAMRDEQPRPPTSTHDRRDQTAIIGHAPEHRDWQPGDDAHPPMIHPTARIEAFVTVDAGMHAPTRIGARTWLMKHVHVGHDADIGEDCELAPHCSIGGHAQLGHGVRLGQGVLVRPFVEIGPSARIGMGAVVVKNVPAGETWAGNPARQLRDDETDTAPGSHWRVQVADLHDWERTW